VFLEDRKRVLQVIGVSIVEGRNDKALHILALQPERQIADAYDVDLGSTEARQQSIKEIRTRAEAGREASGAVRNDAMEHKDRAPPPEALCNSARGP
jgi:hypothetical protein